MNSLKVLVTGGAGFIGHHFVKNLLEQSNWDVTILDRASGRFGIRRLEELELLGNNRVEFYRADFSNLDFVEKMERPGNYDFIIHLGGKTSVNESISNPGEYINSNVVGTQKLLEFATRQNTLKGFFYISTNEVFGPGDRTKGFQEWAPYNCQSVYAATKAAGEELTLAYSIQRSLPVLVVHTMNLFGEREAPEKFIPQIIKALLHGEEIPIYQSAQLGIGGRTYLDARSFSEALLFLCRGIMDGSLNLQREKINIAGEEFITNDELARIIADIIGKPFKLKLVDYFNKNPGHILDTALDIRKFQSFGWKYSSNFKQSLERVVNWWTANPAWLE